MLQQQGPGCQGKFSKIWLIIMNVIYFIFGCLLMGLSSWGISTQKSGGAASYLPSGALQTLVATGVFLVILALAGFLGVAFNSKSVGRYILGFYACMMVLVMIMEFSASLAVLAFVGKLDNTVVNSDVLNVVNGDYGTFMMVNSSFYACCCGYKKCPNLALNMTRNYCWIPRSEPYPCDSVESFAVYLKEYVEGNIQPVAGLALFLCMLQLFTSIVACCNQCQGKKQQEKDKIAGAMSYDGMDGMYGDQEGGGQAQGVQDNTFGKFAAPARAGSAAALPAGGGGAPPVATRAPGPPKRAAPIGAPPGGGGGSGPRV